MRRTLFLFAFLPGLLLGGCKTTQAPKYESRNSHKPNGAVDWSVKEVKDLPPADKTASN
jgi:hypothetical protein